LSLAAWNFNEQHPRTDDAVALANLIGIAPRVSGPIVKIYVRDNQFVKSGDLLFEIDPADFTTSLDSARASVANLEVAAVRELRVVATLMKRIIRGTCDLEEVNNAQ
jgi:multidrug resistance efflux pump